VTADNKSREYGEANPTFTASYSGFKNGETLLTSGVTGMPSLTTLATGSSPVIGSPYTITAALGTLAAGNYSFTFVNGQLSITKATLTVTADNQTKILNAPNPTLTFVITGFKNGETASVLSTQPTCTTIATTTSPIGSYIINCSGAAAANYTFSYADGTLKVLYRFDGFLQPINDTAHTTYCGNPCVASIFKGGSAVPVKFQLKDVNGKVVQSNTLPLWITPVQGGSTTAAIDESQYTDPPSTGTTYNWDGAQYHYNWSTKGFKAGYYWRIGVKFDDGQTYYVYIGLR
jgi:hypothetical protein